MIVSHPYALLTMTILAGAQLWCGRVLACGGKTDVCRYIVQNDSLMAAGNVNEILDVYVRPYTGAIDPDFILMDDNARPQRAQVTNEYLQTATIERMDWPARSPDLNPIKHAWDMLQTSISAHSLQPNTVQEFQQELLDEFARIPQQSIRKVSSGMIRRCRAVIQSNGNHMRY